MQCAKTARYEIRYHAIDWHVFCDYLFIACSCYYWNEVFPVSNSCPLDISHDNHRDAATTTVVLLVTTVAMVLRWMISAAAHQPITTMAPTVRLVAVVEEVCVEMMG